MMRSAALRFAVLADTRSLPRYQARCLDQILRVRGTELVLFILTGASDSVPSCRRARGRLPRFGHLLFRLYDRFFGRGRARSLRPVDTSDMFRSAAVVTCGETPIGTVEERLSASAIEDIRRYDLDFILDFGSDPTKAEILGAARYGVWSFQHDDRARFRKAPKYFWEIFYQDPATDAALWRVTNSTDAGIALHQGSFATQRSYRRNLDHVLLGSTDWPARVCEDILNGAAEYLRNEGAVADAPTRGEPGNREMVAFALKTLWRFVESQVTSVLYCDKWNIGVSNGSIETIVRANGLPNVSWLEEPDKQRFRADPFGISQDDRLCVLLEEFDHHTNRGSIAAMVVSAGRIVAGPETAIRSDHHLSYPYLVSHEGAIYCVPEMHQAGEQRIFRATAFPWEWEDAGTLIPNCEIVDPTLFKYGGYWWLFHGVAGEYQTEKLFAWYSRDLFGGWSPHALNPLKTDVRSSRPAGTPFEHEGHLYRPAQDCCQGYGSAVTLNRIERLSPCEFREEVAAVVRPAGAGRFSSGIHTLSAADGITLVDGREREIVIASSKRVLMHKLRKLASLTGSVFRRVSRPSRRERAARRAELGRGGSRNKSDARTTKELRVLSLVDNLSWGGAERVAVTLACGLRGRGVDARLARLSSQKGEHPWAEELRAAGVPVLDLGVRSLLDPRPVLQLAAYLRRERIDVLHTHLRYSDLVGRAAAALARRPVVCTQHGIVETEFGWREAVRRQVDHWSARLLCAAVVTVSDAQRQVYLRTAGVAPGRVETHLNGVDTDVFRPDPAARARLRAELEIEPQAPLFVAVAMLLPGKGLLYLIEAAALVHCQVPEARFVIVGDGVERVRLEARVAQLRLQGVVRFLGLRSDVPAVLAAADVCVHPSHFEALPTVVLEAMAVGLPVVATNVGGVPEIVTDGETGLLVPPSRVDELAAAMLRLLDRAQRAALGTAGRAWVEAHASTHVWLSDIEGLYRRVATGSM